MTRWVKHALNLNNFFNRAEAGDSLTLRMQKQDPNCGNAQELRMIDNNQEAAI